MTIERSLQPVSSSKLMATLAAALAISAGGMVLVGWAFNLTALKSILPGWVSVKPNTALGFMLTGLALLFSSQAHARLPQNLTFVYRFGRLCGLLAGLLGLLTLAEYAFGWNPGFDQWLFPEPVGTLGTSSPGRMAPDTALCFLLLAACQEIARSSSKGPRALAANTIFGSLITTLALTAIVSYFTRAFGSHGWFGFTIMAVPTASLFAILGGTMVLVAWWQSDPSTKSAGQATRGTETRAGLAFLLVFLMLLAGSVATATSYFRAFEIHHRSEIELQLSSIIELKVSELTQWRKERLSDANTVFKNTTFTALVRHVFTQPADAEARHQLQTWIGKIQTSYQYDCVFLLDAQGNERLAAPDSLEPVSTDLAADAAQAQKARQIVFMDLHRHAPDRPIHLAVIVPIVDESDTDAPLGVLVLRIDPAIYLNPLIQRWPGPSPTGETLLVRREGNEVVFLNELRHRSGTTLALHRPISDLHLPAAKSVRGEFGVSEGVDYRGIAVVAASQVVPDSPWFMIAKVDQAEIYAPVRREAWRTGGVVILLLITTAFASVAFWRQRNEVLLRRQLNLESERNTLVERLALITRHANDIILLLDETGRIVEANDRALVAYGYTLEELRHLPPGGLRPAETTGHLPEPLNRLSTQEGATYETVHRRRNGTMFPVEVNGRAVENNGQKFSLGIYRDITERKCAEMKIEKQNALLNALINSPSDIVIFSLDRNYCYTAFNEKHRQEMRTVWKVDIQIGSNLLECMAEPHLRQLAQQSIDRVLKGETLTEIQFQPKLDIYYEFVWNPIRQKDNAITGVTAFIRDITERKRAEAALQQSEERLALAQRAAGAGMWDWDIATGRLTWARELFGLLGLDPAHTEASNELWAQTVHPEDRALAVDRFKQAVKNGTPLASEYRVVHPDGTIRWIYALGNTINGPDGQPRRMSGILLNITERKRAEEALRESEDKFKFFFEHSNVSMSITQPAGAIQVNQTFCELLGYSPAEFQQKSWQDVTHPDDLEGTQLAMESMISGKQDSARFTKRYFHKNGSVICADISTTLRRNAAGQPLYFMTAIIDITERKRAEEALQRTAHELHEKNAALERFTYTVSHDLKSPLVTIKTFAGFLEKDIKNQDAIRMEKDLKFIHGAAEKMGRLLEDLLDLSRIGRKMNPFVNAPLQAVVQEALDLVAGQIAQRGVTIHLTAEPIILHGDRPRLVEVFQNLLDNAIKFMGDQPSPSVEIGTEQIGGSAVFFVRDNGVGIDPRHHAKLFGLFEKLDPHSEGTGIGLALVKRIIEVHGGKIWAESAGPGQGATFRFTLGDTNKPELLQ